MKYKELSTPRLKVKCEGREYGFPENVRSVIWGQKEVFGCFLGLRSSVQSPRLPWIG